MLSAIPRSSDAKSVMFFIETDINEKIYIEREMYVIQ